jgi:hypothetical protein
MILLELLFEVYHIEVAFSITGHQLMTLMISFLVISKVTLSYDRYMHARDAIGHAMLLLRQLNQTCIMMQPGQNNPPGSQNTTTTASSGPASAPPPPPPAQGSPPPQQKEESGGADSIQRWKVQVRTPKGH